MVDEGGWSPKRRLGFCRRLQSPNSEGAFTLEQEKILLFSHLSEITILITHSFLLSLAAIDNFLFLHRRLSNSRSYEKVECVFKGIHFALTPKERLNCWCQKHAVWLV